MFVLKAAVVIVAGVVETRINSDRPSGAEAASKPAAAQAAITATKIVVKDKSLSRARAHGRAARPTRHDATHSSGVAVPRRLRPDGDPTATVSAAGGTQTARPEASAAAAPPITRPGPANGRYRCGWLKTCGSPDISENTTGSRKVSRIV